MVDESENLLQATLAKASGGKADADLVIPEMDTDAWSQVKARRGQQFFRRSVLSSYNYRCCITGNPLPALLRASHILPWHSHSVERLNPQNGLCLAATQDAAFDGHLITLDEDLRLILSPLLRDACSSETLRENFLRYEGKRIQLPERFTPNPKFLRMHREMLGKRAKFLPDA